jgi:hypothetical protein
MKSAQKKIIRNSRLWFFVAAACACSEPATHWNQETESTADSEIDAGGQESEPSTDIPTDTEPVIPELPELCKLITETELGVEIRQFPLSGDGSAESPDMAFSTDNVESLMVFSYIEAGTVWDVKTASYRTAVDTADGGITYTHALGDIASPSAGEVKGEFPSVAFGQGVYALVWLDGRFNPDCTQDALVGCRKDVVVQPVDVDGNPLGDVAALTEDVSGNPIGRPAVAAVPDGFIAVWTQLNEGVNQLVGALLDESLTLRDVPFVLTDTVVDDVYYPRIASGDAAAVIVFTEDRQTRVSMLAWPHGEAAPGKESVLLNDPTVSSRDIVVAATDGGFLTAWSGLLDSGRQILVRALDESGSITGETNQATAVSNNADNPSIAVKGDDYVLAWISDGDNWAEKCAVSDGCPPQVFATVIDPQGNMKSKSVMLTSDPNESRKVRINWDGTGWTAVYETWRDKRWQLYFSRMVCE